MRLMIGAAALSMAGLLSAASMNAAGAQDGFVCALLADDGQRLDCYDLLFKPTPEGDTVSPDQDRGIAVAGKGKWMIREEISKLDDSKNVFVYVRALRPFNDLFGQSQWPALWIACQEGAASLGIEFGAIMGGEPVVYRIDKGPAGTIELHRATTGKALGVWSRQEAIEFTNLLLNAEYLLVRAIPHRMNAIDVEFPVTGLGEAIHPLREACRW